MDTGKGGLMKATSISPANIAFIKYWGRLDHKLFLPLTTTNSMNLSECTATTTIEFDPKYTKDEITIIDSDGNEKAVLQDGSEKNMMLYKTLERGRELSGEKLFAKVVSKLSFPLGSGIASSAAGLSAFVAAMYSALGLDGKVSDRKELSREVRLAGSPSAARSVEDGFTELLFGKTHEESFVQKIADEKHWDLVDIVTIIDPGEKKISSSEGHALADTSPFFKARIEYLKGKPEIVRDAILNKDFKTLATFSQNDAINMHGVMMTSIPPAFYFRPGSIQVILDILEWQSEIDVFFTFDAGPNAHIITTSALVEKVNKLLLEKSQVKSTIINKPSKGTQILDQHIF